MNSKIMFQGRKRLTNKQTKNKTSKLQGSTKIDQLDWETKIKVLEIKNKLLKQKVTDGFSMYLEVKKSL